MKIVKVSKEKFILGHNIYAFREAGIQEGEEKTKARWEYKVNIFVGSSGKSKRD